MKVLVHWFRKGLRLTDNPTLLNAIQDANCVYPVFVLDNWHSNPSNVGDQRIEFILQSLKDLDKSLRDRGVECGLLFVHKESVTKAIPRLWKELDATSISFDPYDENEPHCKHDDVVIRKLAENDGIEVLDSTGSHWLHGPEAYDDIFALKGTSIPKTFNSFVTKIFEKSGPVPKPESAPTSIPYDKSAAQSKTKVLEKYPLVESLKDLGRSQDIKLLLPGGESHGLQRIKNLITSNPEWVKKFSKPDTRPTCSIDGKPSTTVISPYLAHGCVSVRYLWHEIETAINAKGTSGNSKQLQTTLKGQLLWRELWYTIGHYSDGDIGSIHNNPVLQRDIPWDSNATKVERWKQGQTGHPFVDAIMIQLRTQGWVHHLARHMVACYLTRGDLWQSWTAGAKVFDEYLLDSDWSINNCNWMWLSCSAFFHQYFRVYSPVSFGKKYDKHGDYIRKFIPQLKDFPDKYIYEPWKAPIEVQKKAKCVIGKDYPFPLVSDHKKTSVENMENMKKAFAAPSPTRNDEPSSKRHKSNLDE